MSRYDFESRGEPEAQAERQRLAALEGANDPVTRLILRETGIGPGWHCLELGPGGGSVMRWLAQIVGPQGRVVVLDLDTSQLGDVPANVEVRQGDLTLEPLGEGYDLVHTRAVLEHLDHGQAMIPKLAAALGPGGYLVVEEFTWVGVLPGVIDVAPEIARMSEGFMLAHGQGTRAFEWEPKLPVLFEDAGLDQVLADLRLTYHAPLDPAHPDVLSRSLDRRRRALVETGAVTDYELDRIVLHGVESWLPVGLVSCRGRKPGGGS